jgi:hypothetical protein
MLLLVAARSGGGEPVRVYIEAGRKRTFAAALDWPGWCRSGRDELAALAALTEHGSRYREVAETAGVPFKVGEFTVIERQPGTPTTDFGAPDRAAAAEATPRVARA